MIRDPETGFQSTVLDQGRYIDAPDYARGEMYLGALARYKVAARDALLQENDQLRTKVFANTAESNQHLFQQDTTTPAAYPDKSPDLFDGLTPEQQRNLLRWGTFAPRPPEPEPDTRNSFKVPEEKPVELTARTDVMSDAESEITSGEDNNQLAAAASKNKPGARKAPASESQQAQVPSARGDVRAAYGETNGLYPQLSNVARDPYRAVYDSNKGDPESAKELQKARADIAQVERNRKAIKVEGGIERKNLQPNDPNESSQWKLAAEASDQPSDLPPDVRHFFMRAHTGPQKPPGWGKDREPYRTYGPFINVGGGKVPKSTLVYIDFYRGVPLDPGK